MVGKDRLEFSVPFCFISVKLKKPYTFPFRFDFSLALAVKE